MSGVEPVPVGADPWFAKIVRSRQGLASSNIPRLLTARSARFLGSSWLWRVGAVAGARGPGWPSRCPSSAAAVGGRSKGVRALPVRCS
jgi:hypothetical protein